MNLINCRNSEGTNIFLSAKIQRHTVCTSTCVVEDVSFLLRNVQISISLSLMRIISENACLKSTFFLTLTTGLHRKSLIQNYMLVTVKLRTYPQTGVCSPCSCTSGAPSWIWRKGRWDRWHPWAGGCDLLSGWCWLYLATAGLFCAHLTDAYSDTAPRTYTHTYIQRNIYTHTHTHTRAFIHTEERTQTPTKQTHMRIN